MRIRPIARCLVASFVLFLAASSQAKEPITTGDLLRLRQITNVELAPDASFAVYTVRSISPEKTGEDVKYEYRSHIWMVELTNPGSAPVQLTTGDHSDGGITLSPDGSTLAFVRTGKNDKDEDRPQIWLLDLTRPGEARQLTTMENGASGPQWTPDGAALLVNSSVPFSKLDGAPPFPIERPERAWNDHKPTDEDAKITARPDGTREEIRAWLAHNATEENPTVINRLAFQTEFGLRGEDSVEHLYRVDMASGDVTAISEGWIGLGGADLSPDGTTLAFVDVPAEDRHPDRWRRSAVFLANADGSNIRRVIDDENFAFGSLAWSPDGRSLVVGATRVEPDPWAQQTMLARYDLANGAYALLTEAHDTDAGDAEISESGTVYFGSPFQGGFPIYTVPLGGGDVERITTGELGVQTFDIAGGVIVGAVTMPSNPSELYRIEEGGSLTRLTNHNNWISDRTLSTPAMHWTQNPDGTRVQYWVMPPTSVDASKKYPTVLEMHGGPSAMWGPGEFSMWHEFQLLCAWGYGVVYANPRGSSGYGYQFQYDNFRDWGIGPGGDVLAALEDAQSKYNWIDGDRLFLTGGSYAGYLTAWIVTQDHRFKAAVAQRGVYDLETFFGEGNAWRLNEVAFGGMPWDPETKAAMEHDSPFTHVANIRTPLLIMHASNDLRTGVSQSEMMYRALKELERPVEYIRYPNAGHDLSRTGDARQRMDRLNRIIEFFERYAANDRPAPVQSEEVE